MAKVKKGTLRLIIPAGAASAGAPRGPALGQRGIQIMPFCKEFNHKTEQYKHGTPIRTKVISFSDGSFEMQVGKPPRSHMINLVRNGDELNIAWVYEIASLRLGGKATDEGRQKECQMILGTCKSMHLDLIDIE